MIEQNYNSIVSLIFSTLKHDSYNFQKLSNNRVMFTYFNKDFISDEFLNIVEPNTINHFGLNTISSRLMTKVLYLDHKEVIDKWFDN